MNFLNKKYTSLHGNAPFNHSQSHSRSFLPSASSLRESPNLISSNNCEAHPSEIVRHMCLECVELLCSECIGEHLQLHREANQIPKIMSIRQLRGEMQGKIEHITSLMSQQNPNTLEIDGLRKHVLQKIDVMRKDLVRAVEDWVGILKNHLLGTLGFEDVSKTKIEMQRLKDQLGLLQQSLSTGGQPSMVKKVYQIDADKLREGYNGMFKKFRELSERADFQIVVNWKEIIKNIQSNIVIKTRGDVIEEGDQLQQQSKPQSEIPQDEPISDEPQIHEPQSNILQ